MVLDLSSAKSRNLIKKIRGSLKIIKYRVTRKRYNCDSCPSGNLNLIWINFLTLECKNTRAVSDIAGSLTIARVFNQTSGRWFFPSKFSPRVIQLKTYSSAKWNDWLAWGRHSITFQVISSSCRISFPSENSAWRSKNRLLARKLT